MEPAGSDFPPSSPCEADPVPVPVIVCLPMATCCKKKGSAPSASTDKYPPLRQRVRLLRSVRAVRGATHTSSATGRYASIGIGAFEFVHLILCGTRTAAIGGRPDIPCSARRKRQSTVERRICWVVAQSAQPIIFHRYSALNDFDTNTNKPFASSFPLLAAFCSAIFIPLA
jgi:hypothetical protein